LRRPLPPALEEYHRDWHEDFYDDRWREYR
jgi:hypothetical protein